MVEKLKPKPDRWHLLESWFTRDGEMEAASVDGVPVLIPGKLGDVPVIQIPASATPDVFERISKAVTEACGIEPFIVTSNVQILRMRSIDEKRAKAIMRDVREKSEKYRAKLADMAAAGANGSEHEDGDGDGSEPDGIGAGDAVADVAEGDADAGVEDPAQPGEEPAEEG